MDMTHKANKELFEAHSQWEYECSNATGKYVPCGKPATHVIEYRDQDGGVERRLSCSDHAVLKAKVSQRQDRPHITVSDIEEWKITAEYRGRIAIRVGTRYYATVAKHDKARNWGPFPIFPIVSFEHLQHPRRRDPGK